MYVNNMNNKITSDNGENNNNSSTGNSKNRNRNDVKNGKIALDNNHIENSILKLRHTPKKTSTMLTNQYSKDFKVDPAPYFTYG